MNVQIFHMPPRLSIDQFMDWAATKVERYELVEGTPKLLPWVKRNHARIVSNIDFALQSALDRDRYHVFQGDFAIPTGPASIRYADVLVERTGGDGQGRTAESAVLVVEVLSTSTYPDAFGPKLVEYLNLASLDTYLILEQDRQCVWQWSRDENGNWPDNPVILHDGKIVLKLFGMTISLDAIYRGVDAVMTKG